MKVLGGRLGDAGFVASFKNKIRSTHYDAGKLVDALEPFRDQFESGEQKILFGIFKVIVKLTRQGNQLLVFFEFLSEFNWGHLGYGPALNATLYPQFSNFFYF